MLRNYFLVFFASLIAIAYSKQIDEIFWSFNSIKLQEGTGYPYDLFRVNIGWEIDGGLNPQTGDLFSLDMPYVLDVRWVNETGFDTFEENFNIKTDDDVVIASCDFFQAAGRANSSKVNCRLTADVSIYRQIEGNITLDISFDAGGRNETIPAAKHWVSGQNTITFNEKLSQNITFQIPDPDTRGMVYQYDMNDELLMYYMLPSTLCPGKGIVGGSFYFYTYRGDLTTSSSFVLWNMTDPELFVATELSPYGFPTAIDKLNILDTQTWNSGLKFKVQFGAIPAGQRMVYSFYNDPYYWNASSGAYMHFNPDVTVVCDDYSTATDFHYYRYRPNAPNSTDQYAVPTTVTTTNTWCSDTTSTTFQTGSGATVTEIINVAQKKTSWTTETTGGSFATTYTKNFTSDQTQVTVVVETSIPTTTYTTVTLPWNEGYTTLTTNSYSPGAMEIIVVEKTPAANFSSTTYKTITKPWDEGFTSTYTNPYESGAKEIIVVVETPVSDYNATTITTVTKPWYEGYTRTYTQPFSSGETDIIVIVETPSTYNPTHTTTLTLPYDGPLNFPITFEYPYSSGDTAIIHIVQTPAPKSSSATATNAPAITGRARGVYDLSGDDVSSFLEPYKSMNVTLQYYDENLGKTVRTTP